MPEVDEDYNYEHLWQLFHGYREQLKQIIIRKDLAISTKKKILLYKFKIFYLVNETLNNQAPSFDKFRNPYREIMGKLGGIHELTKITKFDPLEKSEILEFLKYYPRLLYTYRKEFYNDLEIILAGIKGEGWIIKYVDKSFLKNKEVVLCAALTYGDVLKYVDDRFKDDEEIVKNAISKSPESFKFASERIRGNEEIMKEWLVHYPDIINFASWEIRANKFLSFIAIKFSPSVIQYMPVNFRHDRDFALESIDFNCEVFQYLIPTLRKDFEIVNKVLSKNGKMLEYVDDILKHNIIICRLALENDPMAIYYVPENLLSDPSISKYSELKICDKKLNKGLKITNQEIFKIRKILESKDWFLELNEVKNNRVINQVGELNRSINLIIREIDHCLPST